MKIYIVRHGETDYNAKRLMQGQLNTSLNENGRNLAILTGQGLKGVHFDYCFSSPLDRAKETAELILKESGNNTPIELDDRLLEISFGVFEGRSIFEMKEQGRILYEDSLNFKGFENGESVKDVCKRTQDFLNELIKRDDGKTYLVSTHGCAMRAMINHLTGDPNDYWLGHVPYNCSFTIIEVDNGKPKIVALDKVYYDESLIVDRFQR